MIIYGYKSKELFNAPTFEKCPNCGTNNSLRIHVFQKYAHIFWIPFFPIGKTSLSQCENCKQILKHKAMPEALKADFESIKGKERAPIWMFSGLGLAALITIWVLIEGQKNKERNSKIILEPRIGDVFEIKEKEDQFTLYKVYQTNKDSVFIHPNNFNTNQESGIYKLKDEAFTDSVYIAYSKTDLKKMLEVGKIINIDRN